MYRNEPQQKTLFYNQQIHTFSEAEGLPNAC